MYCCGLSPQAGSIVHMSVSFSYKYLALFTDTGHLWTGSSHLQDKLSEVDTKKSTPPKQMVWCRRPKSQQPSVVLMWDRLLMVAGAYNDTIQGSLCFSWRAGRSSDHQLNQSGAASGGSSGLSGHFQDRLHGSRSCCWRPTGSTRSRVRRPMST